MEFFLDLDRLWNLLWLVPLLIVLYAYAQLRRAHALKQLLGAPHFSDPSGGVIGTDSSNVKRFFRFFLLLLTLILLCAAYARPTWGTHIIPLSGAGRDIVFALDVSKSMLSTDAAPSRFAHAQALIDAITERMPGDRFGLIVFGGRAVKVCPLTFDRHSFDQVLNDQAPGSGGIGGTNIERALREAQSMFPKETEQENNAIVLITDGGALTGEAEKCIKEIKDKGIKLIVAGIGDPMISSPIPVKDARGAVKYLKDKNGQTVTTRLEEKPLRELAGGTKGLYTRSTVTQMNDDLIANTLRALTPRAEQESTRAIPIERWPYFLGAALVLFLLFLLLNERRGKFNLTAHFQTLLQSTRVLLIAGAALCVCSVQAAEAVPESAQADTIYNQAVLDQQNGNCDSAMAGYEKVLRFTDLRPDIRRGAEQNLGVLYHERVRDGIAAAQNLAQSDADSALKHIDDLAEQMASAEEFYGEILRQPQNANFRETLRNAQQLRLDNRQKEQLKQEIKEMQEAMKKAAEQTQQAQQQQQQANQSQNGSQKNQNQQQAQQSTNDAQESMQRMEQAADKLQNQQQKEFAKQVAEKLKQALEAQQKKDGKQAKEKLDEAAEMIQKAQKDEQKRRDDADRKEAEDKERQQQSEPKQEEKKEQSEKQPGQKPAEYDRKNAASILRAMAQQEQEARERVHEERMQGKEENVEQDW